MQCDLLIYVWLFSSNVAGIFCMRESLRLYLHVFGVDPSHTRMWKSLIILQYHDAIVVRYRVTQVHTSQDFK